MPSLKMTIPKTISVGYVARKDTYTGNLAYVIYTDAKGKLRKEPSWNSWRDQKLGSETFDNVPTSGFVLNKGVGGARQSYGWNPRNEYIRVYDPRDFEFEISVANLLFILQESNSIRGKGLEGDFVYSWDGADLVLLPVRSQEYTECSQFTECQSTKVVKKDMVEGCQYLMKDMTEVMYLGRHEYHETDGYMGSYSVKCLGKKHIFLDLNCKNKKHIYTIQTGFTKLAKKTSDDALPQYAEEYDNFKNSIYGCAVTEMSVVKEKLPRKLEEFIGNFLIKEGSKYFSVSIDSYKKWHWRSRRSDGSDGGDDKEGTFDIEKSNSPVLETIENGVCTVPRVDNYYYRDKNNTENVTEEELRKKNLFSAYLVNGKGGSYKII